MCKQLILLQQAHDEDIFVDMDNIFSTSREDKAFCLMQKPGKLSRAIDGKLWVKRQAREE